MRTPQLAAKTVVLLSILFLATVCFGQEQVAQPSTAASPASPVVATQPSTAASPAVAQKKVFVFVVRTDRHAKYSKPEVFHDVLNDLLEYLKTKNVAIAVDEFGGGITPRVTRRSTQSSRSVRMPRPIASCTSKWTVH